MPGEMDRAPLCGETDRHWTSCPPPLTYECKAGLTFDFG